MMHIIINELIFTNASNVVARLIESADGTTSVQVFFNNGHSLLIVNNKHLKQVDGAAVELAMGDIPAAIEACSEFVFNNDDSWQTVTLDGDVAISSASWTNIDDGTNSLKFPVLIDERYAFKAVIFFEIEDNTQGGAFAINGPSLATTSHRSEYPDSTSTRVFTESISTYNGSTVAGTTAATTNNVAVVEGIVCSRAGDMFVSAICGGSSPITVKQYSFIKYRKL